MGRHRFGGWAVLGDSYLSRVVAAVLLCLVATACGAEKPPVCPMPATEALHADREKSQFVARVAVVGDADLQQGTTSSKGYLMRTESVLSGQPPAEFALWTALDMPELRQGKVYVVFARDSFSGRTDPVTANGAPVTAFHVAVPGGVYEVRDGKIVRACRDEPSEPVDDDVFAGI